MRKIINGKKYDTETATFVGKWADGDRGSYDFLSEALYRKRTGEYFILGEGGVGTCYAKSRGDNGWACGERITPVGYTTACAWAEQHLGAGEYEAEFGAIPQGDLEQVAVTVRIPADAKAILDRECFKSGRSRGEIVAELLMRL